MKPIQASVRLRPVRIGFLVKPNDLTSVRRIMRYSACLWGGKFNPIIPVTPRLPKSWSDRARYGQGGLELSHAYLDYFEPDVFVEATTGLGGLMGYSEEKLGYSQKRCIPLAALTKNEFGRGTDFAFGQCMFDIYKEMYEKKYQFERRHPAKFATIPTSDPASSAFFEATIGQLPSERSITYIRQAYKDAFTPETFEATPKDYEEILTKQIFTPLDVTSAKLDTHFNESPHPIVFFFDPSKPIDIIDFWNLRATHNRILGINVAWISEHAPYLRKLIAANHRPMRGNPNGVMTTTTLEFSSSISEITSEQIIKTHFKGVKGYSFKKWYTRFWDTSTDDFAFRPTKPEITAEAKSIEIIVSDDLYSWVDTVDPSFGSKFMGQIRWANVLKLSQTRDDSDLALCLPIKRKLSEFPSHRDHFDFLVSREGLITLPEYKGQRSLIKWMKGTTAIADWLKASGIKASQSEAGRIADEMIKAFGGLRGTGRIANEKIIEKLNNMAGSIKLSRSSTGEIIEKEMPGSADSARSWEALVGKAERSKSRARTTLNDLTDANVLRLGLSVQCTHCSKNNWYSLEGLNYSLTCSRCLKSFAFPQGEYDFQNSPWQYRVIGSFSVPDYAMGGYATTLALRLFSIRGIGDHKMTYATGMDLSIERDRDAEFDFALWLQNDRQMNENGKPVAIFGEAKSYAEKAITERDIKRMAKLGERFPGCYLAFAVLKKDFSTAEKRLLSKLALQGRKPMRNGDPHFSVIALTGTELFTDWDIKFTWEKLGGRYKEALGERYIDITRPENLADLTQRVYLGLSSLAEWQHKYFEEKFRKRKAKKAARLKG